MEKGTKTLPEELIDALAELYQEAGSMYHLEDRDPHPTAYVELCLVHARLLNQREGHDLLAREIKSNLSDESLAELEGKGGVTEVQTSTPTLVIDDSRESFSENGKRKWARRIWRDIGPLTDRAYDLCDRDLSGAPSDWAQATETLVTDGVVDPLRTLFSRSCSSSTHPGEHQARAESPGGANDVTADIIQAHPSNPPLVTEIPVERLCDRDVDVITSPNPAGSGRTGCGNRGQNPRHRRTVDDLNNETIQALKARSPLPKLPTIGVPAGFREELIDWRPVLAQSESLMALLQILLTSTRRDLEYEGEKDLTGIPLYHKLLLWSFGWEDRRVAYRELGATAGILLDLFQKEVDGGLEWTGWHSKTERARLVQDHSIPQHLINKAKEIMLSPEDYDDLVSLIKGKSVTRKAWKAGERQERFEYIDDHEPVVTPPDCTRRIQEYLNGLNKVRFSHGSYGVFNTNALDKATDEVWESITEEHRRDQELRKLYWIGQFSQPLYLPCDRSPRQKADRHNQSMNLPSDVLRATYTERDYELDLSKAHLGSYVPVAKREGIEVPALEKYLQANLNDNELLLEDGDLWTELAMAVDRSVMDDARARRKAVKRAYSAVYGSSRTNLMRAIWKAYAKASGEHLDSFAPIRSLLDHELMEELLETRDKLEAIITERGYLEDVAGRPIPLSAWDETKDKADRWRGLLAYVNASFEQEIMAAAFDEARKEQERDARPRFRIWLYQHDGFTVRMASKASHSRQITRLQAAVTGKAQELGVPTELEVDYQGAE